MDKSKHPSLMEHQHMYKRTWREPTPTLDSDTFKVLWKKQRLAEVRDAIVRGDWPEPLPNDSDSSDGDSDSVSTSSTNSPGHHKHHHQQDSDDDSEFEEALQEAADAQLHVVLASLKEQQERELQASRAAAAEIEEQHTATTKQMADIQAQLDELKREKHELFQQLKLVNQAAAREAAAAAAAAQQAAFQQQQRQWQQQQQQMPPPPSLPHLQGQTPFHAASFGGQPYPAGGMQPQQPQSQPTTPRVAGQALQTSSSGMLSPAARTNWPITSPQLQPPPPPPRHMDGAGSSGGGSTPSYQQQHPPQRVGSLVPPAFQQQQQQPHQQPQHQAQQQQQQYALGRQGSWAAARTGQQQHGHVHPPLDRAQSDAQYWASSERGGQRLDRMGSDRLERLSSSGFDGPAHAAHAPGAHHIGRDTFDHHRQQQQASQVQPPPGQHQQQGVGGVGSPYGRSPREGGFSRASKPSVHNIHAPDSPEEGEALPSPPGPAIRKQLAAAAAAQAAAGGAGAAAGPGGASAVHFAEPGSSGAKQQPSPRVAGLGLERAASGAMHGGPGGGGGSDGAYRPAAAGHADPGEDPEGGRGAAHGGTGGLIPAGLRRSSSGGSTSGLHALTSPAGVQRLPRDLPRGLQTTPSDPLAGRRGPGGGAAGAYRAAGGPVYREPGTPGMPGSAGTAGGSFGSGSRGREDGSQLPTPWQTDRRRSSVEGWDRFGHGQDGVSGATGPGPGAGKPWGRQGGRGRGAGGGWA